MLVSLYGIHLIKDNYRFGLELYSAVNKMSVQSMNLAYGIGYLEKEFANADWKNDNISSHAFDSALLSVRSSFGYENMPLLDDVRIRWIERFEELFRQTVNKDIDALERVFAREADEMSDLRKKLENMTNCFIDFRERYNQMSEWERYFVSWRNEQKILNDKVGIP